MCECVNVLMCESLTNELTHLRINEFNFQLSIPNETAFALFYCAGERKTQGWAIIVEKERYQKLLILLN